MASSISPKGLADLLDSGASVALIDVREHGEFNSSHIAGFSSLPRRLLEFEMGHLVPFAGARVVVCDDDGRRARLAAVTLERMGYGNVSVLEGGVNRWTTDVYPTEWGMNVPSKDFGERVEVVHQVPEMEADELHARVQRGERLVILDTRTPEEYGRFCIPGGRSVPGGELALRVTDILREAGEGATVVVNCAGRTRSIIGTRALQRMGLANVYGLKNGTSGWVLAGLELETGADRLQLPPPSREGVAAAEEYAARLAAEDGVRYIDAPQLQSLMAKAQERPVYLVDVRTMEEYRAAHIPGFRWFPGGQAVQRSDDLVGIRDGVIVFTCDGVARSTVTASWYLQMGYPNVHALRGGTAAWSAAGLPMETGVPGRPLFGLEEARRTVRLAGAAELKDDADRTVIFVDTSREFAAGHVPGSTWVPRGWLEIQAGDVVPAKDTPLAVTCSDGVASCLAAATLAEMGYRDVWALEGGLAAWTAAGFAVERGLTGVMAPPNDVVPTGPDRGYADMMHYLRWEEELGRKYQVVQ